MPEKYSQKHIIGAFVTAQRNKIDPQKVETKIVFKGDKAERETMRDIFFAASKGNKEIDNIDLLLMHGFIPLAANVFVRLPNIDHILAYNPNKK